MGWSDYQQTLLHAIDDLQLDQCQFKLQFTFLRDHTEEMFQVDVPSRSRQGFKSFTFFLLTLTEPESEWQIFNCPMTFPQCNYNWCITGENRMVKIVRKLFLFLQ